MTTLKKRLEECDNLLHRNISNTAPAYIKKSFIEIKEYFHRTFPATISNYEQFVLNLDSVNRGQRTEEEALKLLSSFTNSANRKKIATNVAIGSLLIILMIMQKTYMPSHKKISEELPDFVLTLCSYLPIAVSLISVGLCLNGIISICRTNDIYDQQQMLFRFFKPDGSHVQKQTQVDERFRLFMDV